MYILLWGETVKILLRGMKSSLTGMKNKIFIPWYENFTFHSSETTFHTKVKDSCMMKKTQREGKIILFALLPTKKPFWGIHI